jgi:hypothetical protein
VDPVAILQAPDAADGFGADFGRAVAIRGDWIAVGAPDDRQYADDSGAVYLFRREGARWVVHQKLKGLQLVGDDMGFAVAMDGDWLVAGAPSFPSGPVIGGAGVGRAYVFRRTSRGTPQDLSDDWWEGAAILNPPPSQLCCNFGVSLDIAGDVIVVGRVSGEYQLGSAYVFRWDGAEWLPDGVLVGSDTQEGDSFGSAVATNGEDVFVGAPRRDEGAEDTGAAYVFERHDGGWVQISRLLAPDPASPPLFGSSIAADDSLLVVTPHVLRLSGKKWLYELTLSAQNASEPLGSGGPVSVTDEVILIGPYFFGRRNGQWHQAATLTAGWSVALHGTYAVAGAYYVAFVHRICDGCGTLREFATVQNCMYADTTQAAVCGRLDFREDGHIDLADYGELVLVLVGP